MTPDEDQLRLLSIFHYVVGGIAGLCALVPVFHLVIGLFLILSPETLGANGELPPTFIGWFFFLFATICIIVGLIFAACILVAGRCLAKRRHHTFCLVIAGVECLFMPLGTVLGVFTIVVLMRDSVRDLFLNQ